VISYREFLKERERERERERKKEEKRRLHVEKGCIAIVTLLLLQEDCQDRGRTLYRLCVKN
jgi:hypothetical protein